MDTNTTLQLSGNEAISMAQPGRALDPSHLPPVLTIEEAARLLRINRKTLYASIRAREGFPARRVGRSYRVMTSALLRWMSGEGLR